MKKKIIIFTVGGSTEPIINVLRSEEFDYVFFICTKGRHEVASERLVDGHPIKEGEKIIVTETGLKPNRYKKIPLDVSIVDDINEVYSKLESTLLPEIDSLCKQWQNVEIIANYTGGTKSMSIALVLLALYQEGWLLQISAGPRTNLIRIDSGDFPIYINKTNLNYKSEKIYFDHFMQKFYYEELRERVERFLRSRTLLPDLRQELMNLRNILRVLILWDKFEHIEAESELDYFLASLNKGNQIIEKMQPYRIWIKKINGKYSSNGYEKVIDLFYNAKRRVLQERYDDAVARYYRAIEMLAQIRLFKEYRIDTSNINCNELKELPDKALEFLKELCNKNADERGRLRLGLINDYELLERLNDKLGSFYKARKKSLFSALEVRNNSILAHGNKPILSENFKEVESVFEEFIVEGLRSIGIKLEEGLQLPKSLKEIGIS